MHLRQSETVHTSPALQPSTPRTETTCAPRFAIGSLGAVVLILFTLTFVFTTAGGCAAGIRHPRLSPMPGQFLAKDVAPLAIAISIAAFATLSTTTTI